MKESRVLLSLRHESRVPSKLRSLVILIHVGVSNLEDALAPVWHSTQLHVLTPSSCVIELTLGKVGWPFSDDAYICACISDSTLRLHKRGSISSNPMTTAA